MRSFSIPKIVEFSDTDMAGIVHYSNYFKYFEAAEAAFFRSLGLSFAGDKSRWNLPRTNISCSFKHSLKFEQEITISIAVAELREKSLTYDFVLRDAETETVAVSASVTVVCVEFNHDINRIKARPLPAEVAVALKSWMQGA